MLNPGSDYGKAFTREELTDLVSGTLGTPPIDFVQTGTGSGLDDYFSSQKPFYRKKRFGLF